MAEPAIIAGVLFTLIVQVAITAALFAWGRWVARRRGTVAWARAAWLPVVAGALWLLGTGGTILGLVRAFARVAEVSPEQKAVALAAGIETAMWSTALFSIPSGVLYLVALVAFAVGSRR
ncbi:MAG: MotA/TolQ/ExbB proton channel family protein [Deltaproteobacteria bacterium]|nr:MotA/TolQ/ExbB proton channel family protein [Deltaproteobacteria bacterium]